MCRPTIIAKYTPRFEINMNPSTEELAKKYEFATPSQRKLKLKKEKDQESEQ